MRRRTGYRDRHRAHVTRRRSILGWASPGLRPLSGVQADPAPRPLPVAGCLPRFRQAGARRRGLRGRGVVAARRIDGDYLREVVFFDTPGFHLYEGSFIVRRRTCHRDGWPIDDPELTFKFRHPDFSASAAATDVRPARTADYRIKFKEEILPLRERAGGMRSLYSHTCVLQLPDARSGTFVAQAGRAFPALRFPILAHAHAPSTSCRASTSPSCSTSWACSTSAMGRPARRDRRRLCRRRPSDRHRRRVLVSGPLRAGV